MPSRKARGLCYCDSKLMGDGRCKYRCSPYADPDWLRLQAAKRAERDAHRRREERIFITVDDLRRVRRAIKKFDPVARHMATQARKAARARYRMGGAK